MAARQIHKNHGSRISSSAPQTEKYYLELQSLPRTSTTQQANGEYFMHGNAVSPTITDTPHATQQYTGRPHRQHLGRKDAKDRVDGGQYPGSRGKYAVSGKEKPKVKLVLEWYWYIIIIIGFLILAAGTIIGVYFAMYEEGKFL